eukprot:RCo008861
MANPSFPCLNLSCPEGYRYKPFSATMCPAQGCTESSCCTKDVVCGTPATPSRAELPACLSGLTQGMVCTFGCTVGSIGGGTLICTSAGIWNQSGICEAVDCGPARSPSPV